MLSPSEITAVKQATEAAKREQEAKAAADAEQLRQEAVKAMEPLPLNKP